MRDTGATQAKAVTLMSGQQTRGVALLLVGVIALGASMLVAWTLSQSSRMERVESPWRLTLVSLVLFAVGIVLCWFGVSTIVEG
jgi:hypothetical protein